MTPDYGLITYPTNVNLHPLPGVRLHDIDTFPFGVMQGQSRLPIPNQP